MNVTRGMTTVTLVQPAQIQKAASPANVTLAGLEVEWFVQVTLNLLIFIQGM